MGCDLGSGADFEQLRIHANGLKVCVVGSSKEEHSSQSALELLFETQEKERIKGR